MIKSVLRRVRQRSPILDYSLFQAKLIATSIPYYLGLQRETDGSVVPPPRLRYRVHGRFDAQSYLAVARTIASDVRAAVELTGRDLYSFERVLDFGCGSGRVLWNFRDHPASCTFVGTDIDREAIAWCRGHLSAIARFDTNDPLPPTRYSEGEFDLIYGVSVFTHLDEEYQNAWLTELQRITKPGGHLVLTIHGTVSARKLPSAQEAALATSGFLFVTHETGWMKRDGLPDYYQVAFHTQEYVRREWGKFFDILAYVEHAINAHQDAVVLRRRERPPSGAAREISL